MPQGREAPQAQSQSPKKSRPATSCAWQASDFEPSDEGRPDRRPSVAGDHTAFRNPISPTSGTPTMTTMPIFRRLALLLGIFAAGLAPLASVAHATTYHAYAPPNA